MNIDIFVFKISFFFSITLHFVRQHCLTKTSTSKTTIFTIQTSNKQLALANQILTQNEEPGPQHLKKY